MGYAPAKTMRVVGKLTIGIALAICVVLGLYGWHSVQRERDLFESDTARDDNLLGRALSAAIEETWQRDGSERALALLRGVNEHEEGVRVRWIWLDAPAGDRFHAPLTEETRNALKGSGVAARIERRERGESRLYTYVPVAAPDARAGALELSESLEAEEAYVGRSVRNAAATIALLVVVSVGLALGLGAWLVGRPVDALVARARRIGEGILDDPPLALRQNDELGWLAREMSQMCQNLRETRDRLARETAARIATLDQLRHADRLTTVGKLASGIAHELGTPLNVVSGRAKMIVRGLEAEPAKDCARIVVEQADRMTRIIRQLLDFARQRGAQKAPTDVAALARQTVALLEPLARKRDLALRVDAPEAILAEVDAGQMQQVVTNLVMNAVQAMSTPGEVVVTVERSERSPPPDLGGHPREFVVIRVRDQGPGIAPEHLPHVFEPFFTTKDVGEGTGLGLSVAYGMVREHGGFLDVASTPGQGATFSVHLPAIAC